MIATKNITEFHIKIQLASHKHCLVLNHTRLKMYKNSFLSKNKLVSVYSKIIPISSWGPYFNPKCL